MLLKRRKPPSLYESCRIWLWPRHSWLRSGQYVTKRILRLTATPHAVAAGVAAGAFTSFTPFMGLHFFLAFVLAWLMRGNLLASALGTFVGNPLTFPFIWAATYKTGQYVLNNVSDAGDPPALAAAMKNILNSLWQLDGAAALTALNQIWTPILFPMSVGGMIIGPLVAIPIYIVTRRAAAIFREGRRKKLMSKAAEIQSKAKQLSDSSGLPTKAKQV